MTKEDITTKPLYQILPKLIQYAAEEKYQLIAEIIEQAKTNNRFSEVFSNLITPLREHHINEDDLNKIIPVLNILKPEGHEEIDQNFINIKKEQLPDILSTSERYSYINILEEFKSKTISSKIEK